MLLIVKVLNSKNLFFVLKIAIQFGEYIHVLYYYITGVVKTRQNQIYNLRFEMY